MYCAHLRKEINTFLTLEDYKNVVEMLDNLLFLKEKINDNIIQKEYEESINDVITSIE